LPKFPRPLHLWVMFCPRAASSVSTSHTTEHPGETRGDGIYRSGHQGSGNACELNELPRMTSAIAMPRVCRTAELDLFRCI